MNIVVTGSLGYDYIMGFPGTIADRIMPDKLHAISLSLLADKLNKQFGGTAGNIAYSLKLLGSEPLIQTYAGNDFAPYKTFLQKHQINTSYISIDKKNVCGTYFVVTDNDDNQIGAYYKGALVHTPSLTLKQIREPIHSVVISPNEPNAMIQYVGECTKKGIPYLYDPAFQIGNFSQKQLLAGIRNAAVVVGNDYEIALMEKKLGMAHAELRLLVPILITTLGAKGSLIETNKKTYTITPAKAKNTIDPTGAGDAYRAGFLAGYIRGFDLQTCGQMGSVAAVYTVETYGTQTHVYTKEAFCRRYKETYNTSIDLSNKRKG